MGKYTPALGSAAKREYLEKHLFNELRWLLDAATEWSIQHELALEEEGYQVQVYAMDSAFVHARTLFEFFLKTTSDNYYGVEVFLDPGAKLVSSAYKSWGPPLHSFLMHAQDRSAPVQLDSPTGKKDLNLMPVEFAKEVLRLWEEFERELGKRSHHDLETVARGKRLEAIKNTKFVVNSNVAQCHAKKKKKSLTQVFK
jgi:hypothetical protein